MRLQKVKRLPEWLCRNCDGAMCATCPAAAGPCLPRVTASRGWADRLALARDGGYVQHLANRYEYRRADVVRNAALYTPPPAPPLAPAPEEPADGVLLRGFKRLVGWLLPGGDASLRLPGAYAGHSMAAA